MEFLQSPVAESINYSRSINNNQLTHSKKFTNVLIAQGEERNETFPTRVARGTNMLFKGSVNCLFQK